MKKNKYRPGMKIKSMAELAMLVEGGQYIYLNHKPMHPGWIMSMQFRCLMEYVWQGRAFMAVRQ